MVKFIFIIVIAFALFTSSPISATIHGRQVRVNMDQMTINGSIDVLSQLFDMKIVLISNKYQFPQDRFDLNLEQATLEQSIKEVMRRAKVKNHALFLNQENKTVLVWILSEKERETIGIKVRNNVFPENDPEPLTSDQLVFIAQHNQGRAKTDDESLSQEQMEQLSEQSVTIEAETDESMEPLTPEQIEQLQEQSLWIEDELEVAEGPLSAQQLEQLLDHYAETESENESDSQPLSKEQLFLLKEQEQKY